MKKALVLLRCLFPVVLFAADSSHAVFLNGKPLSHAVLINGEWFIPVEDIARACGSDISLEPVLKLERSTLKTATITHRKAGKGQQEFLVIKVNHEGTITNHVLVQGSQSFVPLTDFARAAGGVWTPPRGGLAPGAPIQLNFAKNPNAILIGL